MLRGLAVTSNGKGVFLCYSSNTRKKSFSIATSSDGSHFKVLTSSASIIGARGLKENLSRCSDFRISHSSSGFFLVYKKMNWKKKPMICIARSKDLIYWKTTGEILNLYETGMVLPPSAKKKKHVLFLGEGSIYYGYSKDHDAWDIHETPVLKPRSHMFDGPDLEIGNVSMSEEGILLNYYAKHKHGRETTYSLGIALLDKNNPSKVLWRTDAPLWEQPEEWGRKGLYPIGVVDFNEHTLYYWGDKHGQISFVTCPSSAEIARVESGRRPLRLARHSQNPIIEPKRKNRWESKATFNPGALYEAGRVHLIYRAIGDDDISVFGYASSADGINFDERLSEPAYVPREPFEGRRVSTVGSANLYGSGGGSGGCEDPRLTKIGDTIYMTYVAYDGWSAPRVALTSISVDDFLKHRWSWSKPVLISAPNEGNKNAVIFPELIKNKFVLFHRIWPDIIVDFVDSLSHFDGKTTWLSRKSHISPRKHFWDSRKVGAGSPPLKTKHGWLMIYQSVGNQDPSRYKIGAMLLDEHNPSKVLARSRKPILEPREHYENNGFKFGVAYPCGSVIKDDQLLVYYGGADTVTCVASAPLDDFLTRLLTSREPRLQPITW